MTPHDPLHAPGECAHCDAYSPKDGSGSWHIRRDVPLALMGTLVAIILAIGGWVWWFSHQASAMEETQRRVTVLETRRDVSDKDAADVVNRLARIEGMVSIMLNKVGGR